MFSGKVLVFGQKWLYSGKGGCIRAKVVVFGQRWLYSGKRDCIRATLFYSGNRAKVVIFGQIGCNHAIWLYSDRVVFFAKKLLYLNKMVVIWQKLLFSGKSGCIKAKWF